MTHTASLSTMKTVYEADPLVGIGKKAARRVEKD
jgi:hypothetical protein